MQNIPIDDVHISKPESMEDVIKILEIEVGLADEQSLPYLAKQLQLVREYLSRESQEES